MLIGFGFEVVCLFSVCLLVWAVWWLVWLFSGLC